MTDKISMEEALNELALGLEKHVNSNGGAHAAVSTHANGFMTSNDKIKLDQCYVKRRYLLNSDLLTLDAGYYEGAQFSNHPLKPSTVTDFISIVDVTKGLDGRQKIEMTDSITGRKWYRTIHTGGDSKSGTGGWVNTPGEVVLWEGNSKMTSTVTLSRSQLDSNGIQAFRYYYADYITAFGSADRAEGFADAITINPGSNLSNEDQLTNMEIMEARIEFRTPTTAIMSRNVSTIYTRGQDGTVYSSKGKDDISILRIVGVV